MNANVEQTCTDKTSDLFITYNYKDDEIDQILEHMSPDQLVRFRDRADEQLSCSTLTQSTSLAWFDASIFSRHSHQSKLAREGGIPCFHRRESGRSGGASFYGCRDVDAASP